LVVGKGKKTIRGLSKGGEGRREYLVEHLQAAPERPVGCGEGEKTITGLPKVGRGEGSTFLNWMRGLVAGLLWKVRKKMNPHKLLLC